MYKKQCTHLRTRQKGASNAEFLRTDVSQEKVHLYKIIYDHCRLQTREKERENFKADKEKRDKEKKAPSRQHICRMEQQKSQNIICAAQSTLEYIRLTLKIIKLNIRVTLCS